LVLSVSPGTLTKHMFVLGIDPGLTTTGYGVVEVSGGSTRAVAAGVIRTDPLAPMAARLADLHTDITDVVRSYTVDEAAIEEVFVNRNLHTAMAVGRASGVVMLALAQAGVPVTEYTPSAVKLTVTGSGSAGKEQVARVVTMRLSLHEPPDPADAADALAVALCHAQALPLRQAVARVAR
jgi:crossover junction endodeoxyribonuclease RuvC